MIAFNLLTATMGCTMIGVGTGSITVALGAALLVLVVKEDWYK